MDNKSKNTEENRDKRLDNLIPFEPGQSGNPNGRPLGQKNYSTLYREALIKLAKLNDKEPEELELEMISKGILSARAGDYRFYKDVLDRLLGTAVQKIDHSTLGESLNPERIRERATSIFNNDQQGKA
jgi:hypothetical protein